MQIVNNDEQYPLNEYENIIDAIVAAGNEFKDINNFMICDSKKRCIYGVRIIQQEVIWRILRKNKRGRDFRFWDRWK